MWASIKKAINSNLKKPLNILTDELSNSLIDLINFKGDEINDYISNIKTSKEKIYEISDTILYEAEQIDLSWVRNYNHLNLIGLFVPKFNGVIKLDITLVPSANKTNDKAYIFPIQEINTSEIYVNNDKYFYSLTNIGDRIQLPTDEKFTTANLYKNVDLSSGEKKTTILVAVKANIPLKIMVSTRGNSSYVAVNRTLSVTECKIYGEEVVY